MKPVDRIDTMLRVLAFAGGCGLTAGVALYAGLGMPVGVAVAAASVVFCASAARLPHGGYLFPSDSVAFFLCLASGRTEIVVAGLGSALAASSVLAGWKPIVPGAVLRTVGAMSVCGLVWRHLAPPEIASGGMLASAGASASAVPAMIAAALTFAASSSGIEALVRTRREVSTGQFWRLNSGRNLHHAVFTLLMGGMTALASMRSGVVAFVLFAFPVLLTRDAVKRSTDLRQSRKEALRALSSAVDARDRYTYDHSSRVSRLSVLIAREMGFPEATVEAIESGALLHDIGKISTDCEILSKPGPLDERERIAIRRHPVDSADVISRVELFKQAVDVVKHHHERPDGRGYPRGLKGHQIPVGARILNVADAFDAMTSDRPYRKRKALGEALHELKKGSGTEFDPVVVEYLVRLLAKRKLHLVRSETR